MKKLNLKDIKTPPKVDGVFRLKIGHQYYEYYWRPTMRQQITYWKKQGEEIAECVEWDGEVWKEFKHEEEM